MKSGIERLLLFYGSLLLPQINTTSNTSLTSALSADS